MQCKVVCLEGGGLQVRWTLSQLVVAGSGMLSEIAQLGGECELQKDASLIIAALACLNAPQMMRQSSFLSAALQGAAFLACPAVENEIAEICRRVLFAPRGNDLQELDRAEVLQALLSLPPALQREVLAPTPGRSLLQWLRALPDALQHVAVQAHATGGGRLELADWLGAADAAALVNAVEGEDGLPPTGISSVHVSGKCVAGESGLRVPQVLVKMQRRRPLVQLTIATPGPLSTSTAACVSALPGLPDLQSLCIHAHATPPSTSITAWLSQPPGRAAQHWRRHMQILTGSLKQLQKLHVSGMPMHGDSAGILALALLTCQQLQSVRLPGALLSAEAVELVAPRLQACTALTALDISTDEAEGHGPEVDAILARPLSGTLRQLRLPSSISREAYAVMLENCTGLQCLATSMDVRDLAMADSIPAHVFASPHLKRLQLHTRGPLDVGLAASRVTCLALRCSGNEGCAALQQEPVASLQRLTALRHLRLRSVVVMPDGTSGGLAALGRLERLTFLRLHLQLLATAPLFESTLAPLSALTALRVASVWAERKESRGTIPCNEAAAIAALLHSWAELRELQLLQTGVQSAAVPIAEVVGSVAAQLESLHLVGKLIDTVCPLARLTALRSLRVASTWPPLGPRTVRAPWGAPWNAEAIATRDPLSSVLDGLHTLTTLEDLRLELLRTDFAVLMVTEALGRLTRLRSVRVCSTLPGFAAQAAARMTSLGQLSWLVLRSAALGRNRPAEVAAVCESLRHCTALRFVCLSDTQALPVDAPPAELQERLVRELPRLEVLAVQKPLEAVLQQQFVVERGVHLRRAFSSAKDELGFADEDSFWRLPDD